MKRRSRYKQGSGSVHQIMTDISLSSLGIILVFFTLVTIFYNNAEKNNNKHPDGEVTQEKRKQKIIRKEILSIKSGGKYTIKDIKKMLSKRVVQFNKQKESLKKMEEDKNLANEKLAKLESAEGLVLKMDNLKKEKKELAKMVKDKKQNLKKIMVGASNIDSTGRPHFIYTVENGNIHFYEYKISRASFKKILYWITDSHVDGGIFARVGNGRKPSWLKKIFSDCGWGPSNIGLK